MIRFIRNPQPHFSTDYKEGMVRDLGATLNAQFIASGDAVDFVEPGRVYPAPQVVVEPGDSYAGAVPQNQGVVSGAGNAGGGPLRFVSLGDSNMFGWNGNPYSSMGEAACALSGGKLLHVKNAGIGGNTSADMAERIQPDVLAYRPDVVIVQAGTNDGHNSTLILPYLTNIADVILGTPGVTLVICSTIPSTVTDARPLAAQIQALVTGYNSPRIRYAATCEALTDAVTGKLAATYAVGGGDLVHITPAGGEAAAVAVLAAISDLVAAATPVTAALVRSTATNSPIVNGNLLTDAAGWVATGGGGATGARMTGDSTVGAFYRGTFPVGAFGATGLTAPSGLSLAPYAGRRVCVFGYVRVTGTPASGGMSMSVTQSWCEASNTSGSFLALAAMGVAPSGWRFFYREFDVDPRAAVVGSGSTSFFSVNNSAGTGTLLVDLARIGFGIVPQMPGRLYESVPSAVLALGLSRVLIPSDHGKTLVCAADRTITIPLNIATVEACDIALTTANTVTVTAASGVTLNGTAAGSATLTAVNGMLRLRKVGTNAWIAA